MTETEKKQIKSLWESGMSFRQICQMISMPVGEFNSVIAEMKRNGEFSNDRKKNLTKVLEAFDNGERDARVIADTYRLKLQTVYFYLNSNGRFFGTKTRNWVHTERTLAIIDDLREGKMSQIEIAKKHGVSKQYITKMKHKLEKGIIGQ
jgi:transposase